MVTSRYDENNKHLYPINPTNEDLYEVTDKLGISRDNIHFMNMGLKADYLNTTSAIWHLDDDDVEIRAIDELGHPIIGVPINDKFWENYCDVLIDLKS